ncbi:ATPase [Paenibacillus sp. GSMTC-2017]|uniref:ATPase n=1 Tax=Paenibacillus sp. GSMTC-2017 TaxID=2794350 RepID=UPI0018D6FA81|nr:ATPase [Paenibacillus sp. GSMTC-2017]MBH5320231.1 ATPase [Paenibacillus sp. GSMTC-2017]
MLQLGSKVIIVADQYEQKLPVGEYGFIIAYDRNADNVFDYVVRVPKANRNVLVPDEDVELEETLIQLEVDRIERDALIDYALATFNEDLFNRIMKGDQEEIETDNGAKEPLSRDDFIRQVNLKAWI